MPPIDVAIRLGQSRQTRCISSARSLLMTSRCARMNAQTVAGLRPTPNPAGATVGLLDWSRWPPDGSH